MTLRTWTKTTAVGIAMGLFATMAVGACAEARPIGDLRIPLSNRADGYELEVLVDGVPAPTFFQRGGTYVLGQMGERYTLRVTNHTGRRIEAVVSVDGRDVVDGRAADYRGKRGYLVPAYGQVEIDGWRLTRTQAAAFRFSTVADSYAARTGSAREVGVIGAAIFPERYASHPVLRRPLERLYRERMDPHGGAPQPRDKSAYDDGGPARGEDRSAGKGGASAPQAAPSSPSRSLAESESARRPGLGTEFGEAVGSAVYEVAFVRESPSWPSVVLGARYNDRDGLVALGVDVPPDTCPWQTTDRTCERDSQLRQSANPFPVTERRYAAPPLCWNGRGCRE